MKLIYFTALNYPSNIANSKQVFAMAKCFREALGDDFIFIINSNNSDENVSNLNPLEINCRWKNFRTLYNFFWAAFNFGKFFDKKNKKETIIYSKDANLYLISLLLKTFFGYKTCFESHMMFGKLKDFIIAKFSDYVVCTTSKLKSELVSIVAGEQKAEIFVEPDAVDLEIFDIDVSREEARKILGIPNGIKIIGYTGSFRTFGMEKGVGDAIKALSLLEDKTAQFWAIGGKEEDVKYYEKIAKELEIPERVRLSLPCDQPKLALYQKAFDVLVMPFPYTEHFAKYMSPLKMFEYMASGTPIITSDLPSIREILDEESAILVSPDDPQALAERIEKVLADQTLAQHIAQTAFKNVRGYTWAERARAILATVLKLT